MRISYCIHVWPVPVRFPMLEENSLSVWRGGPLGHFALMPTANVGLGWVGLGWVRFGWVEIHWKLQLIPLWTAEQLILGD